MKEHRERLVYRILSGHTKIKVGNQNFILTAMTPEQKYKAELVYQSALEECKYRELLSEEEVLELLYNYELWDDNKEKELKIATDNIENIKLGLYENLLRSDHRKLMKTKLRATEEYIDKLYRERHGWDYLTPAGIANLAKFHYTLLSSLRFPDNTPVYEDESFFNQPNETLENVVYAFNDERIAETDYRDLCRHEPWQTHWTLAENASVLFDRPIVLLTDEQKRICMWSRTYDNIYGHHECPSDEIIEDNDMLDGWMIFQKRKRQEDRDKNEIEGRLSNNQKIRNADEIFVPVDNVEDAKKINTLNSPAARATIQQRMKKLNDEKVVKELAMPDRQQEIRFAIENMRKS